MNIQQNNKLLLWEALINSLREKERKNTLGGKRKEKKKIVHLPTCV